MSSELLVLISTAATLGVAHTAIGIDHTLPFIVLGRARHWPIAKTLLLTAGCGVAHVLSSVFVGAVGWGLGLSSARLEGFESGRGDAAAWLLILFGLLYAAYGLYRLRRGEPHRHMHFHADGTVHSHEHEHEFVDGAVHHQHDHRLAPASVRPSAEYSGARQFQPLTQAPRFERPVWPALVVIFILGPCEALVPLMFGSAMLADPGGVFWVAGAFGAATVLTMTGLVWLGHVGLSPKALSRLEPHLNWLAGVTIALSGFAVQLGL